MKKFEHQLKNKIVVITGASSGMGKATAELLAAYGVEIYLCARTLAPLNEIKRKYSQVHVVKTDLTKLSSINKLASQIKKEHAHIDALLCFAGYSKDYPVIRTLTPGANAISYFGDVIATDLVGTTNLVFSLFPLLKKSLVLFMGSTQFLDCGETEMIYQVAKAGLKRLMDVVVKQNKKTGLKMVMLAPGNVQNKSTADGLSKKDRAYFDKEGWLDSAKHIAPLVFGLVTGKIKVKSGDVIRPEKKNIGNFLRQLQNH